MKTRLQKRSPDLIVVIAETVAHTAHLQSRVSLMISFMASGIPAHLQVLSDNRHMRTVR